MRRYSGSGHGFGASPPITAGLVFFGDLTNPSTSVISGAVATYADSSGNGRNFTQGTALNRPNYTAQDATFGNRPSMTFGGATQFLQLVAGFVLECPHLAGRLGSAEAYAVVPAEVVAVAAGDAVDVMLLD